MIIPPVVGGEVWNGNNNLGTRFKVEHIDDQKNNE
jgi:hypothetical protein